MITSKQYEIARTIMGDDIIFPKDVSEAYFGVNYNDPKILNRFSIDLPSIEILTWCKNNHYALVAGPPVDLSMVEIYQMENHVVNHDPTIFHTKNTLFQEFYSLGHSRIAPEWIAIRKEIVGCRLDRIWNPNSQERLPTDAELLWFILTFYKVRKIKLFPDMYALTSSPAYHTRVIMGYFGDSGLEVRSHWGESATYDRGIAPCLALKQMLIT